MEKTLLSNASVNFAKLNFPCQNHILWAFVRFLLSGVSICPVSNCPVSICPVSICPMSICPHTELSLGISPDS